MKEKKKITYEFLTKDKKVSFRISTLLYKKLQEFAHERSIPSQKCIREAIELYLGKEK
jgi:predicted DNA binding CopG/RHH family protein